LVTMRIVHGLHNIAAIPVSLSHAERRLGLDSSVCCHASAFQGHMIDEVIAGPTEDLLEPHLERYDIFNFHFGYSYYRQSLADLPRLKAAGKRVVMHYHGCDLRNSKLVLERHPISACAECWPMACNANRVSTRGIVREFADLVTVSTPDLLEFVPDALWLPQPVDIAWIEDAATQGKSHIPARRSKKTVWVAHAPSSTQLKGTRFVVDAVEKLKAKGVDVELALLTNMPREDVMATIRAADVVVDQLLFGSYGVMAIEAMTLGKPVICHLRPDVIQACADLPIIPASPEDIVDRLADLVRARGQWPTLGAAGRAYARKVHDSTAAVGKLVDWYRAPAIEAV
jgi:glycosyltransferase involved in cell wall biosynthesis